MPGYVNMKPTPDIKPNMQNQINNPANIKNAFKKNKKVLLSFGLRPGPAFGNSATTDFYG